MQDHEKIAKHAGNVTVATGICRILGYIRDMLIAQVFGAGMFADAFYAAYRIPNLFRRLLGEGSMSTAFVPVFSSYLATKKKEEIQELLNVVYTVLLITLVILTLAGMLFAKYITGVIAWGFSSTPEKLELAVSLTRIMFPNLLFVCLAALTLGVLNSLKRFFIPAIAPASLSVVEIAYTLGLLYVVNLPDELKIRGLAYSVVLGGVLQFLIQQFGIRKEGYTTGLKLKPGHPGLKEILKLLVPATIGFSADQIDAFVNTICASFLQQGAITALYYSNRLMQLPLALFGLATVTVSMPLMAQSFAKNDIDQMKQTITYSIRMILFTLLPATAGLIVLGLPIIRLLFERGKFTYDASLMTYSALAFYSTGLLAYSLVKILAGSFYAMKDARTPVRVAIACVALNIVLNLILMWPLGVGGLALATSIASFTNAFTLFYLLRKRIGAIGGRKIMNSFIKITSAVILMSFAVYFSSVIKYPFRLLEVAVPISLGILVYFVTSKIINIEERIPILALFGVKPDTDYD